MEVDRPLTAAAARRTGISRSELRGPLWRSPSRDVHVWSALPALVTEQRIREAAALLPPEGAVTGWAAAYLLGATSLDGTNPQTNRASSGAAEDCRQPVPLLLPLDRQMTRRADVRVIRSPLPPDEVQVVRGVRVTTPWRTAFEALRWVTLGDAVVAADAMGYAGVMSLADAAAFVGSRRGWKHVGRARTALRLADARAESPMETRLRLLWTSTDLPWPDVNPSLYDKGTGEFLARPDLFDAQAALAVEYDGAYTGRRSSTAPTTSARNGSSDASSRSCASMRTTCSLGHSSRSPGCVMDGRAGWRATAVVTSGPAAPRTASSDELGHDTPARRYRTHHLAQVAMPLRGRARER